MSHNSTLGYSPNPLLDVYQTAFLRKLQYIWKGQIGGSLPPDDFLLYPDIHGLLLAMMRPGELHQDSYMNIITFEYQKYIENGGQFNINQSQVISGTNIALTLDFHNPDVEKHTHPDHKKNHVGITFGEVAQSDWQAVFTQAFDILKKVSPGFMTEIDRMIQKIIPFDVSPGVHNSGSYSDVIGHLLMSYPTLMSHPELALLEAILHEYNHNKLNLIMQTETLILSDRQEIYYSPYRPDARHIHGIYLGLHAIAGAYWVIWNAYVSGIIDLPQYWQEKSVLYVLKNGLSLQVLDKYGKFSPLGCQILEEMRSVHQECLQFIKISQLDAQIIKNAKTAMMEHFNQVKDHYPGLRV